MITRIERVDGFKIIDRHGDKPHYVCLRCGLKVLGTNTQAEHHNMKMKHLGRKKI